MLRVNKEPVPAYGWLLGLTSFVILVVLCLMSNLIIFGSNMFLVLTLGNQIPCFVLIGLLLVVLIKHCSRTIWKPWILLTLGLFCASLGHLSMWFHVVAVVLILGSVCIMFMQFKNNAKTLNFVIASATLIILLAAFMAMSWYDLFSAQGQNILVIIALISVNIALASSFAFLVGTASLRKANDMGNPLVWATSGLIMISAGFFLPYMLESFNLFQNAVMARDVLLSLGAMLVCVGVVIDNQQQRELRFE